MNLLLRLNTEPLQHHHCQPDCFCQNGVTRISILSLCTMESQAASQRIGLCLSMLMGKVRSQPHRSVKNASLLLVGAFYDTHTFNMRVWAGISDFAWWCWHGLKKRWPTRLPCPLLPLKCLFFCQRPEVLWDVLPGFHCAQQPVCLAAGWKLRFFRSVVTPLDLTEAKVLFPVEEDCLASLAGSTDCCCSSFRGVFSWLGLEFLGVFRRG